MNTIKKNLYTFMLIGACLIGFASCVDDEGSYENRPVNEVTIVGMEDSYSVIAGVTELDIQPEIEGTLQGTDESNYEYTWYVCLNDLNTSHEHTVLSHEKNLKTIIELAPKSYKIYLSVHDKETGIEWLASSDLEVETVLMNGFYVFGDKEDGTVGMDFLSMPTGQDSVIIKDIFVNERGLRGAENLIFTGSSYSANGQCLWATTTDGSYQIENLITENSVFDVDDSYYDGVLFYPTLDVKRPIKVLDMYPHQASGGSMTSGSNRGFVTEDAVYVNMITSGESYGNPVNRYDAASTTLFHPYKMAFYMANYPMLRAVMLYDLDNERFTTIGTSSFLMANSCRQLTDNAGDVFKWNDPTRTIVYGENCPDYYSYAVMKDKEGTNYYVYIFYVASYLAPSKYAAYTIDTSQVPNFAEASYYSFYINQSYILYTVGSQLWGLNYAIKGSQPVMLHDFGAEITYMTFDWVSRGAEGDIVVCTYDEANKGTIYKYEINNDPNVIEIRPIENCEWKTDLKVKKLEFRSSPY